MDVRSYILSLPFVGTDLAIYIYRRVTTALRTKFSGRSVFQDGTHFSGTTYLEKVCDCFYSGKMEFQVAEVPPICLLIES